MWGIEMAAALALAAYGAEADAGPGRFLRGRTGAVIVADLASGGRFSEEWGPRGAAPPASLFKAAAARALARAGRPAPLLCSGRYEDRGRPAWCSLRSGHGLVTLRSAFAQSCNRFFRGRVPEKEALLSAGLELGLVRPAALAALRAAPVEDLVLGLPRPLALTPAELLEAAALWPQGPAWEVLAPLLAACGREGTCREARVPGMRVAGKTGTAPAADGSGATSGWFLGFAPAESPRVAVVAFLDRGQGRDAAALAGEALRWWFPPSSPR